MISVVVTSLLLQAAAIDTTAIVGARNPSFAPDGRMVLSINGHLMLQPSPGASLVPLTSGSSWDRDPSWVPDGSAVVFASDRDGNYDIWRLQVNGGGAVGVPTQITRTTEPETYPSVGRDGRIAFLRGSGNATRVWIRDAAGTESRLTKNEDTELVPQFSHDGVLVALLSQTETVRRLLVWAPAEGATAAAQRWTQSVDNSADHISWAWDNQRIAVSTRTGVFVVPRNGGYSNFATSTHGHTAWSPADKAIIVASFEVVNVQYNGDPDRGSDRTAILRSPARGATTPGTERLTVTVAPIAPSQNREQVLTGSVSRADRNAAAFDRVWELSSRLYFSSPSTAARKAQWERVRAAQRPRALAAQTDSVLEAVIHDALKARPTLREGASGRAVVSSAHPVATDAGLEVMRLGGNVVDAAVATSFALGVVEPDASGVAGYGEMVIALKTLAKPTVIEFMTRVPEDAGLGNTSLMVNGRYPGDGPVLVNVPGTVAGMYAAWKQYGSKNITWASLLAPAIRAAKNGYEVSEGLATTLATEREHFAKYEGSKALFFRNGEPLAAGDTLRNPDLAWVLEQIAAKGADGFYTGEVAQKWVNDLHAKGNAMKLTDLARYFAPERDAVEGTYRNYKIYSSAPPVSGGAELVARFNLLEQFTGSRSYRDDAASLHAALTAWFLVPSSRGKISDPSLWPVDYSTIIDKDTARVRWQCYDANRALRPDLVRGDTLACLKERATTKPGTGSSGQYSALTPPIQTAATGAYTAPCGDDHAAEMHVCHSSGTTAFTVADNDGNMVAVTQTLGTWGGNFYVTPGLGFLSNDKLTSYGSDPSQYGSRLPFMRNGSTLAPTIVYKNGKPFVGVGAAGNAWITSAVYQVLLGVLDYDLSAQQALELPRFLPGGGFGGGRGGGAGGAPATPAPYTLQLEDGFAPEVTARLRTLGYNLSFVSLRGELREGYGAAVRVDGNTATAGADPRRSGAAGAIKK